MKTAPLSLETLSDFDVSAERGFLPARDPLVTFSHCATLETLGRQLPKLLASQQLRKSLKDLQVIIPTQEDDWDREAYRCANRILSFAAHGYIWEIPDQPADYLPSNLAIPWCHVSRKLGRPPVLSYASYALDNWRRVDPNKPIELDNIELLQNFLGGLDEEWFVLVHVEIEAKAGPAMGAILHAHEAAVEKDPELLKVQLETMAAAQEAMCQTLDRMPERCDPYIYFNRVRPFIHGWKDNPALRNGLVYDGVEEFHGRPQFFRGETGAQSSIIPVFDAALGITHSEDPLTHFLCEMRQYMPPAHRDFLETLEHQKDEHSRPLLAGYIGECQSKEPDLWKAYRRCVQLLARFRGTHLDYAASYIHQQSERRSSNATSVGTGGTPFMAYLRKHLEETKHVIE
ncbi:MAG: hypothetical protein VST67_01335 [Nitrospirota bacterium]|nr:hypothetical protein [Nitrospirota bacterium]